MSVLSAYHSAIIPVQVKELRGSVLIEPECSIDDCLQVDESLVRVSEDGLTTLLIINNGKSSYQLRSGIELAQAYEVDLELTEHTSEEQLSTSHLGDSAEIAEDPEMQTFPQVSLLYIDSSSGQKVSQMRSELYRLWAVSSLPIGNVYCNEHLKWRQQ